MFRKKVRAKADPDNEKSQKVFSAMLPMEKLDSEELKRAYAG